MKLRGSYGKVGNDGIGTGSGIGENGRYVYLPNIGKDSQDHYIIKSYGDPTVQWEIAEQVNLGLEMTFWNGLLDFTLDVYQEIRHNILSQRVIVPASMGLGLCGCQYRVGTLSRGFDFAGRCNMLFRMISGLY